MRTGRARRSRDTEPVRAEARTPCAGGPGEPTARRRVGDRKQVSSGCSEDVMRPWAQAGDKQSP